ncbi:MAG: hypothetical protein J6A20_01515 [Muribaculaceae bacterium]|nr:hypothetical protein [Muribaculaceae bacterium]
MRLNKQKIRLGDLIEAEVRKQQYQIKDFADKINTTRDNLYKIFGRSSLDTDLLKRISLALGHNYFRDIADDMDLIYGEELNEEELLNRKAVSQFWDVVPAVLQSLGKSSDIMVTDNSNDFPVPDFLLIDYNITFTIGETFLNRFGVNKLLPIEAVKNEEGDLVEISKNLLDGTKTLNIEIKYRQKKEWERLIKYAFEVLSKYKIIESWNGRI